MDSDGVFQLRTCQSEPGKLDAVIKRIGGVGAELLVKHGGAMVGLWSSPDEGDPTTGTVVYVCRFPDRAAAQATWDAFHSDEQWLAARAASEADGPIIESGHAIYMTTTEYSPRP